MNQKLINSILFACLAILGFLQIKGTSSSQPASASKDSVAAKPVKVAYVDLDSLQEKYILYKEKIQEFEKKKESADRDLNGAFQKIENERMAFAKRGESITQAEFDNFQRSYQMKMQNLEEQKRVLENNIAADGAKTMEDLKSKINTFLVDYNKTHGYSYIFSYSSALNVLFYKDTAYDITNDVVAGLNEVYKKSAGK
jgi:outer membrane protein